MNEVDVPESYFIWLGTIANRAQGVLLLIRGHAFAGHFLGCLLGLVACDAMSVIGVVSCLGERVKT